MIGQFIITNKDPHAFLAESFNRESKSQDLEHNGWESTIHTYNEYILNFSVYYQNDVDAIKDVCRTQKPDSPNIHDEYWDNHVFIELSAHYFYKLKCRK